MNTSEATSKAGGVISVSRSSLWNILTADKVKHFVAGGIAGAVSRTSVSPFERLKILYQVCNLVTMVTNMETSVRGQIGSTQVRRD